MKLTFNHLIKIVFIVLSCPIVSFCQSFSDRDTITEKIEEGRWTVGFSPSAFIALNPNLQVNVNYFINDYLETNLEVGYLSYSRQNRTLNKFVLRPEFRFFPYKKMFFLGVGTHLVYFKGKTNYFHFRNDFTFQKQFQHSINNMIVIPTFHLGVKGNVTDNLYLTFATYAGVGWRNVIIDSFPAEYTRTSRAPILFDFSMFSEREISYIAMLHFNFNISYRFR